MRTGDWDYAVYSPKNIRERRSWSIQKMKDLDWGDNEDLLNVTGVSLSFINGKQLIEIVIPLASLTAMVDEVVREYVDDRV